MNATNLARMAPGILALSVAAAFGVAARRIAPSTHSQDERIERGIYLTHRVAMCIQCHTPRDERGELELSRLFQGAPIPVEAPPFTAEWAPRAPALAGLHGWTDEAIVTLLMTGVRPNGTSPRPPMPPFRLSAEDAGAIAAYLRSLDASQGNDR
jgi:mono/diheme cytochrome c family protein